MGPVVCPRRPSPITHRRRGRRAVWARRGFGFQSFVFKACCVIIKACACIDGRSAFATMWMIYGWCPSPGARSTSVIRRPRPRVRADALTRRPVARCHHATTLQSGSDSVPLWCLDLESRVRRDKQTSTVRAGCSILSACSPMQLVPML